MEKEFESLVETLKKFEGFSLIDTSIDETWIHFNISSEESLSQISNVVNDIREQHSCNLLMLTTQENPNQQTYQLVIDAADRLTCIRILTKNLNNLMESKNDSRHANNKELGLPDLSLVTIRQMATELKARQNLTFALVWIESNERDNIAIEGSGNPTQLVGLLARGQHMAIEWADKNIKFYRPKEEE